MKKLKYLLLILTLIFIPKVNASTKIFDREEAKNYGVNKHWTIDSSNTEYVLKTPLVDASELIYDFSDILTDEEEEKYYQLFKEIKEKYNMDVVFVSYDLPYSNDKDNEDFAADFYDFNDFGIDFNGYSGVLLFRNTYEQDPYYDMLSFGDAQLYYNSSRMSDILDDLYYNIHNGNYDKALDEWLEELDKYHNQGKIKGYHVNNDSYLTRDTDYIVRDFNPYIGSILIIDIIITTIFITIKVRKNRMVYKATNADLYLDDSSFKLLEKTDRLIGTHTTSWTESTSSSSGGGGSHSSGGHSGGGHSSGGGRHG